MSISVNSMRQILDESYEAIYVTDFEYNILYANKVAQSIGKELFHVQVVGTKCYQCMVGRDAPCSFCKVGQLSKDHYLVRNFSGDTGRIFELRGKLIDWDGTPAHIEYIRDITKQRRAEQRSEELYTQQRNLYDHVGIGMCLYQFRNGEMRALVCNDAYRQLFQLPEGFSEGMPIQLQLGNFYEEDKEQLRSAIIHHILEGKSFQKVCRILDKQTGLPRSVLMNVEGEQSEGGGGLWYVSAYDVTEWTESESQLNNVLNNISGGIAVYQIHKDGRARRLMYTDGLLKMQGYDRQEYEELGAEDAMRLVYREDRDRLARELLKSCRKQEPVTIVYRVQHKQKGYIWVNLTATPIGVDAEGCLRYNAVFTNASQQFELYQQMLDNSENAVIVTDRSTREVYFTNRAAKKILNDDFNVCNDGQCRRSQEEEHRILCETCKLLPREEEPMRKIQMENRTYQVYTHQMDWMDRPAAVQYLADISDEIELQSKLASDEERYRLVVEKSGIALMDYDLKTDTVYMNDCFRQYAASESPDIRDFFNRTEGFYTVHPEDVPLLERFYRELGEKHTAFATLRLKKLDGTYRWTEMNALEIWDEKGEPLRKIGFFQDVDEAIRQYEDLKIRYDYEMARQSSFENGVVERILLDLTEDKVVQAANPHTASLKQLVGMSIKDLAQVRLSHTEGEKEKAELRGFMDRNALLQAYYTGETPTLEMLSVIRATGDKKYFLSTAQLAKNPGNGHIIAFIETRDNDRAKMEATLMRRLLETSYESAIVVDVATGKIKIGISAGEKDFAFNIDQTYEELAMEDIIRRVLPEEREQTRKQMSLDTIRKKLEETSFCSGRAALEVDGELFYKMWTAVYFDELREYILLTIANVTEVYKRDLQNAQELKTALEDAKVASQAKNTFLARMSHEIRTPITTVSGIMDLMRMACRKGDIRTEELQKQIETADAANQYLLTLINDILDISKIESNELHLNPVPVNIREVIEPMCAMIRPLALKKHINLILERKSRTTDWYKMDGVRVQQILMNLLNNAIKFTPEGGTVKFTGELCYNDGKNVIVRFVVRDNGVGISEDFKDSVFEPFRQEYTDSKSGYGGTGIGLSISRKLARMMGGDITFESEKGKGSTFTVTMRLEMVPPQETQEVRKREEEMPRLEGIRILLCEDNRINQAIVCQLLEAGGCIVTTADDGQQAVEQFSGSGTKRFDLILMDIQMPKMDGLEATRRIRAMSRPDAGTVPIIAMSANAYEEDRQISLAAGMNEHLSKPVDTEELYRVIHRYCREEG